MHRSVLIAFRVLVYAFHAPLATHFLEKLATNAETALYLHQRKHAMMETWFHQMDAVAPVLSKILLPAREHHRFARLDVGTRSKTLPGHTPKPAMMETRTTWTAALTLA